MAGKVEKLLAKGRSLEGKGRREKALEVYRDACRVEPYDPDLWTARAKTAESLGLRAEAAEALFHVCELYARSGMPAEALPVVKQVLRLDSTHGGAKRLQRVIEQRMEAEAPSPSAAPSPAAAPTTGSLPSVEVDLTVSVAPPPPVEAVKAEPPPPPEPEAKPPAPPLAKSRAATVPPPVPRAGSQPPVPRAPSQPPAIPADADPPPSTAAHALDELSLADRLPTAAGDIVLDEDGKIDVVRAVASTLTSSPLLSELDSDLVRLLIDAGKLVHRGADEIVFRQGDVGTSLYLILGGEVAVVWENRAKKERRELARLRPGAFFGEMALLTNTPRSATVVATNNADFLEISRKAVRDLIDRDPRVLKLLMRFFRARLVGTLLQTSPLFKPFDRDERRALIARFRLRELGAEHTVITEGAPSEGLFVVLVGRLEVLQSLKTSHRKDGGDGLAVLLGTLAPGDVFGEMSLLDDAPAIATVRTRTRAWVLLLPRADFADLLAGHPQIREHLTELAEARREKNRAAQEADYREERVEPV